MSGPSAASFCAIASSDRMALASSASISARMRLFTASADTAPPPSVAAMPDEKKYFSSNNPRAQDRYLLLVRSEEHTSELQSLMRISYAVFCLKKKKKQHQ